MLRELAVNLTTGALCRVNLFIAALGPAFALLSAEEKARIFAATMTGVWFLTQTVLAIINHQRKRRD